MGVSSKSMEYYELKVKPAKGPYNSCRSRTRVNRSICACCKNMPRRSRERAFQKFVDINIRHSSPSPWVISTALKTLEKRKATRAWAMSAAIVSMRSRSLRSLHSSGKETCVDLLRTLGILSRPYRSETNLRCLMDWL